MAPPTGVRKRQEDPEDKSLDDQEEEGENRQRMDWVGALLKDTRRLNFESKVRKVGRSSGMIILPGAWVGRRVKVSVELLD